MVIEIELSKTGKKYRGMYKAIVDDCDADLAELNWSYKKGREGSYAAKQVNGKEIFLHWAVLERVLGRAHTRGELVDHINMNGLDNRRENLRLATYSQNQANKVKTKRNKSGYKGVYLKKGTRKYHAQIKKDGRIMRLGSYDTAQEAHEAYCNAAKELHGEFWRGE